MAYTTIDDSEAYFQCKIFTGTGSSLALTLDGDTDMQPDLVWVKARTSGASTNNHGLFDAIRGTGKSLESNRTVAEQNAPEGVTAFGSDGFTLGTDGAWNESSIPAVAWCWKMNGTGSANTEGSLNTAANSVSTTAGQAIISYTGNGTDGATIGHGLDTAPDLLLLKDRDNTRNWRVLHTGWADASKNCLLNSNTAIATRADDFNSTYPSATLITLGGDAAVNGDTEKYMIYAFSSIQGYSKFSTFVGNGDIDGPFVYTGFKPAFVLIKATTTDNSWHLQDNKRSPFNLVDKSIYPHLADAEETYTVCDFTSQGFKMRTTNAGMNNDGVTKLYMAFAEAPFVNSNGVPCNAR